MSQKRCLQITDFDKTQMYKDRNPIWIKLHCAILDDYEFSALPDENKFHALGLMILAARLNNRLPDDERWLRQKINANSEINLKLLLEIGFLEVVKDGKKSGNVCKTKKIKGKFVKQSEKLCEPEQNRTEQMKTEEKKTEHTTTDDAEKNRRAAADAPNVVVCDFSRSSKTENQNEAAAIFNKSNSVNGDGQLSKFTLAECLSYVQLCIAKGDAIKNPHGLAISLFQTGKSDAFIRALMFPEDQKQSDLETYGAPVQFSADPCAICFGAKMADVDGKGYRKCERCRSEKGISTGFEPRKE